MSDIVTNLILIGASVALATIVFFWGLSYLGQSQSSLSQGAYESNVRVQEQFTIETVFFWGSSGGNPVYNPTTGTRNDSITIFVRNFGDIPISVVDVFIDGARFTPSSEVVVRARTTNRVNITQSSTLWTPNETYTIRVVSERGNIYENSYQARNS